MTWETKVCLKVPIWPLISLLWTYTAPMFSFGIVEEQVAPVQLFGFCKQYMDCHHPDIIVVMELREDAERLCRICQSLVFHEFHYSNRICFSGGIIIIWLGRAIQWWWQSSLHTFNISIWIGCFSVVYASPGEDAKKDLVVGDLDDILGANECKKSKIVLKWGRQIDLLCILMDLVLLDQSRLGEVWLSVVWDYIGAL